MIRRTTGRTVVAALTALTTIGALAAVPHAAGAATPPTLALSGASTVYADVYDGEAYFEDALHLVNNGAAFELWSHRASYSSPITTSWHHGSAVTELPAGTMDDFSGLSRFFETTLQNAKGQTVLDRKSTVCLNSYGSYRARPDGAAHSLYPYDCPSNLFTRGSVQGIAAGWATDVSPFGYDGVKLAPGRYRMRVSITPYYRQLFGIPASAARVSSTLVVRKGDTGGKGRGAARFAHAHAKATPHLTGARLASAPDGPRPDLVSLPAWGISLSKSTRYLNFSATVYNAGNSPLVVDGFREKGKDVMDAYQYFYDSQGNETGYVPAGHMEWDPRPSHLHWHFEDFARYQLLSSTKQFVQLSHKEAFCLADTDAIDYTVPGANWRPYNTDLSTACGDHSAIAVSEVLDQGSGDTYTQERAGQSFDLKHVPNGVYYVAIVANPDHVLTEQSTANNVALRKIRLGGTVAHRRLAVAPVGDING